MIERYREWRRLEDDEEFEEHIRSIGMNRRDKKRIIQNQTARFRAARDLGYDAHFECVAEYLVVFGKKILVSDMHTSVVTCPMSFEDKRKVLMTAPNKTAADYRAAGYID
jgi:hypothetical protein